MKRDWELIRKILIKLEEESLTYCTNLVDVQKDTKTIFYHYDLLRQAKLAETENDAEPLEHGLTRPYSSLHLTWAGHEFLSKIKNDTVWKKTKYTIKKKGFSLSFDLINAVATKIIMTSLQRNNHGKRK